MGLSVKKLIHDEKSLGWKLRPIKMYGLSIRYQNRGSHQGGPMHNFKDVIALFSKDEKRKVGAIILENDSLIQLSCGYNGLPRRLKETKKRWLKKNKDLYVIHAETNAIVQAAKNGVSIK